MSAYLKERKIKNIRGIGQYRQFAPEVCGKIAKLAKSLAGKTVLHVNATAEGGGVAELLASQVAIERSLDLDSRWYYIKAGEPFFQTTKKIHNLLQGMPGKLSLLEQNAYLSAHEELSQSFTQLLQKLQPHVVVIHDPQPLPLAEYIPDAALSILRLHVDLSEPNQGALKFLKPYFPFCRRIVVSSRHFINALPAPAKRRAKVIAPAIDPLTEKNRPMPRAKAASVVSRLGIDPGRPLVVQVSRFDPWKDPVGVIEAYKLAKQEIPDLQLALAGIIQAKDDPQAFQVLEEVRTAAGSDPDIHVLWSKSQLAKVSVDQAVSALFTASAAVLQKSLKEGFGLTITEAMWKGKAVIGGNANGVKLQIADKKNGLIAGNILQAAKGIVRLVEDGKLKDRLGAAAKNSVAKNFLLPRFIYDNLKSYL